MIFVHYLSYYLVSYCLVLGVSYFQLPDVPVKVRKLVVKVCDVITRRAARLAAAGIVGILKKIGRDGSWGKAGAKFKSEGPSQMRRTIVAIEGGLYTSYTTFREYLNEAMKEILGEEVSPHVILKVMEDGSGTGAALVAAANSVSEAGKVQLQ